MAAVIDRRTLLASAADACALERGGSAADAYLTAAFAQAVLEPTMTTLAGALGVNYFEAATGRLHQTGGGFRSPAAETPEWSESDSVTGRAVMVPGWVRGAEAPTCGTGFSPELVELSGSGA
jgi:gamma-glutamyltranspeptidase/glutathione hydrolase